MRQKHIHTIYFFVFVCFLYSCKEIKKQECAIILLRGPSGVSMTYMMDSLQKCASHFQFKVVDEPNQVKASILKKEAGFYLLPMNMASILYNKGASIALLAVPVWGTIWLAGNKPIKNWNELKGSTVHLLGKGTTPDIVFRFLLLKHKINPEMDLKLDYSFPEHSQLAQALASGKADLAIISEPFLTYVMRQNAKIKPLIELEKEWNYSTQDTIPFAQTALVVNKEMAKSNPELVKEFINLYCWSIKEVNKNHAYAGHLTSVFHILPDSSAASQSIARCRLEFVRADTIKHGIINFLKVFYTFNPQTIGGKLPDEDFFYKYKD